MYQFKQSTNEEIEKVITALVCFIMVFMPITYLLQDNEVLNQSIFSVVSPSYIILCICGILMLMLICMYFRRKENRKICLMDIALILMTISLILSTMFSQDVGQSVGGCVYTQEGLPIRISYLIIFFSVTLINNKACRKLLVVTLLSVGAAEAVIGILQTYNQWDIVSNYTYGIDTYGGYYRAYGTVQNPNPYGAMMLIFAGISTGFVFLSQSVKVKVVNAILTVLYLYAIFLSGTRAAILGYACMVPVELLLYFSLRKKIYGGQIQTVSKQKKFIYGMLAMTAVVGIVLCVMVNPVFSDIFSRTISDLSASSDNAANGRGVIWKQALIDFSNYPVTGIGLGGFRWVTYEASADVTTHELAVAIRTAYFAHNELLNIMAEQGVIGLITTVFFVVIFFFNAVRILFNKDSLYNKMLIFACIISVFAYIVDSMFGYSIIYTMPYLYVVYALAVPREEMKSIIKNIAYK